MSKSEEIAKLAPEICQLVKRAIREERKAIGKIMDAVLESTRKPSAYWAGTVVDYEEWAHIIWPMVQKLLAGERPEE